MKKRFHKNEKKTNKKSWEVILMPDKIDFKTKAIPTDKEDPAIPLWGIYPKKPNTPYQKDTYIHMFTTALLTIA